MTKFLDMIDFYFRVIKIGPSLKHLMVRSYTSFSTLQL